MKTMSAFRDAPAGDRWALAPHVRACASEDQVVLLDLRRDRYLAVGAAAAAALAHAVDGWPHDDRHGAGSGHDADAAPWAQSLAARGLLVDGPRSSLRLPHACVPEATASLGAQDAVPHPRVGLRRSLSFARHTLAAATALRSRSLWSVVRAAARRRARRAPEAGMPCAEAALDAVAAYEWLRVFVYTSRDRCLFDSLALTGFLADEDLYPHWVIGVRTDPFAAHSWVQSGHTVLNDLHERVRRFKPILVV
jgi:Transglutaminase-like superfamily